MLPCGLLFTGLDICTDITLDRKKWEDLYKPLDFFSLYKHYIVICAKAFSEELHVKWSGLVESKVRILVSKLEYNEGIELAHIYPTAYGPPPNDMSEQASMWFIGLEFKKGPGGVNITITYEIQVFTNAVLKSSSQNPEMENGTELEVKHVRRKQLADYLPSSLVPTPNKRKRSVGAVMETPSPILYKQQRNREEEISPSAPKKLKQESSEGTKELESALQNFVQKLSKSGPKSTVKPNDEQSLEQDTDSSVSSMQCSEQLGDQSFTTQSSSSSDNSLVMINTSTHQQPPHTPTPVHVTAEKTTNQPSQLQQAPGSLPSLATDSGTAEIGDRSDDIFKRNNKQLSSDSELSENSLTCPAVLSQKNFRAKNQIVLRLK